MEENEYIVMVALQGTPSGYKEFRLKAGKANLRLVGGKDEVLTLYTGEDIIAQFVNPLCWYNFTRQQG